MVFFEKENINTLDCTDKLMPTILSSVAQQESEAISVNTRWGVLRKFEQGKVLCNYTNFLGYTRGQDGGLAIVHEGAEIVKLIFRLYRRNAALGRPSNN